MRVIGIVLFVLALAAPAAAQRSVVVAGGLDYVSYETDDPNLSDLAKMLGFIADASVEITPWLHMAGQVSRIGSSARLFCVDDIDGPCVDARVSALTTAVGPRLRFQINEQTHGFAHVLLGSQRGSGTVSADLGGAFDTAVTGSFAERESGALYGGGIDIFPEPDSPYGVRVGIQYDEAVHLTVGAVLRF